MIEGTVQPMIDLAELYTAMIFFGFGALSGALMAFVTWAQSNEPFSAQKFFRSVGLASIVGGFIGINSESWKIAFLSGFTEPAFRQVFNRPVNAVSDLVKKK